MFRDFKSGGYNLEELAFRVSRLIADDFINSDRLHFCHDAWAYNKTYGIQKYVGRVKDIRRTQQRHRGLYRAIWTNLGQFHGPV